MEKADRGAEVCHAANLVDLHELEGRTVAQLGAAPAELDSSVAISVVHSLERAPPAIVDRSAEIGFPTHEDHVNRVIDGGRGAVGTLPGRRERLVVLLAIVDFV